MIKLLVNRFNQTGGIESVNALLRDVFEELGLCYSIISINGQNDLPNDSVRLMDRFWIKEGLLRKVYNRTSRTFFLRKEVSKEALHAKHLIVTHLFLLEFVTLKVLATTNCILWCHGIEVWNINYLKKYKEKLSQVSTFVCVSNFTSNFLIEFGISKKKILIIHNAVDVNFFKPCFSNSSKQAFELLTVSRLSSQEQYKGHDLVLNSLASLKARKNIDFRYTIVGDGDDRWRLQQFCNDLGLQSQVEFVGKVSKEELLQYYRRCTAFIMPSYVTKRSDGTWCGEGLGIVYLEAMACAKPVIASLKGGQTEVVVDGMTGLLVEPTVEAVTFAIKNLYDKSNEDLEMMGVQGRAVVEENFSISYFRKAIQELLNT